jgi:quercetin dioxygenase-like cupin family protein
LIALVGGRELGEHYSPGEATLQVLAGEVKVNAGSESWKGAAGDFLVIPAVRHSLQAVDDSVVLLTVRADSRDGIH